MEQTFIMVKPDGVQRGLVGEVIQRLERKGYQLDSIKKLFPSQELIQEHYSEHKGRGFYEGLVQFVSSGPVVAMVWSGPNIIHDCRILIGQSSQPGTIRGDFVTDVCKNVIHGSDSPQSAEREIKMWFQ